MHTYIKIINICKTPQSTRTNQCLWRRRRWRYSGGAVMGNGW